MANRNETTTAFKVDISDLKKAMQDAKRQVALANSEFKAASSACDDWTTSSEGLSAKLKQLDTTMGAQKKVLSVLERQYEDVVKEQGANSKAAQDLQIKINNQRAAINNTQRQITQYTTKLNDLDNAQDEVGDSAEGASGDVKDLGDSAGKAEGGFTTLKGAIASFVGNALSSLVSSLGDAVSSLWDLADSTTEYRQGLNQLETAFGKAGMSAEETYNAFNYFGSVLGDTRKAQETMLMLGQLASSEAELAAWTDTLTGVYATYGQAIPLEGLTEAVNHTAQLGEVQGTLADALEWGGINVEDFNTQLATLNTEEDRAALIQDTLNGLYGEAAATYNELNKDILDASTASTDLENAQANLGDTMRPLKTLITEMQAGFLNELVPSLSGVTSAFKDLLTGVDGADTALGNALKDMIDFGLTAITDALPTVLNVGVTLIQALIEGILSALPQVLDALVELIPQLTQTILDLLPTLIDTAAQLVSQLLVALGDLLPEIVLQIVDIIPQLIDALLAAIPQLLEAAFTFLSAIVEALPEVITSLLAALPMLYDAISQFLTDNIPLLLDMAINFLMTIVEAIPEILTALVEALPEILTSIISYLLSAIPLLLQAAIKLLLALVQAIPTIVVALANAIPQIITAIIDTLLNNIPLLLDTAVQLLMAIVQAIPQILVALAKAIPQIVVSIINMLMEILPKLATLSLQIASKIGQWGVDMAKKGKESAVKLFNSIVDKIKELPDKLKSIGKDIVKGLWNGINDMTSWITDKVKGFGDSVLSGIKDFFGIASPSKVMAKEVGKWIPEGIAVGIDKNAGSVLDSMKSLTMGAVEGARAGVVAGASAGVGGAVYNFYQTNNSPKALSRVDIYRQSKNLLGYAGGV